VKTMRAAIAALTVLVAAGCSGVYARQDVLLPAMQQVWPSLREQAARAGAGDAAVESALQQADTAVATGVGLHLVAWQQIDDLVLLDIQQRVMGGAISAGVALSQQERLTQFQRARGVEVGR